MRHHIYLIPLAPSKHEATHTRTWVYRYKITNTTHKNNSRWSVFKNVYINLNLLSFGGILLINCGEANHVVVLRDEGIRMRSSKQYYTQPYSIRDENKNPLSPHIPESYGFRWLFWTCWRRILVVVVSGQSQSLSKVYHMRTSSGGHCHLGTETAHRRHTTRFAFIYVQACTGKGKSCEHCFSLIFY